MTSIEIIIALGIATYGGVEIIKHVVPDYYQRSKNQFYETAHERIDDVIARIDAMEAKVKGAKK